jgi:hypothetical protein
MKASNYSSRRLHATLARDRDEKPTPAQEATEQARLKKDSQYTFLVLECHCALRSMGQSG